VLYDLSSSDFEGECCPLAQRGYSRDGKKGTLQVDYGLLTDARGFPVSISVFAGNTSVPLDRRDPVVARRLQRKFPNI
jgi:transposase